MTGQRIVKRRYVCKCGFEVLMREHEHTKAQTTFEDGTTLPGVWCPYCRSVATRVIEEERSIREAYCKRCLHRYRTPSSDNGMDTVCPSCGYMPMFGQYQPR